jgi:hypothetical protein
VIAAALFFLFGAGLTASGVLWSGMYDIGILVMVVGLVGVAVRLGHWVGWLRS